MSIQCMSLRKYARQIGGSVIPADLRFAARPNPSQVVIFGQSCTLCRATFKEWKASRPQENLGARCYSPTRTVAQL